MAYYKDVREWIAALETAGKLTRISRQIDKDTEMHPLVRLQYRALPEERRKAFLFENVVDSRGRRYDMPVLVGGYAGTSEIYALGMACRPEEIFDKWTRAQVEPVEPVVVETGPCQERIITGPELASAGLDLIPVPISTPGFDSAPFTTASHFISRDPETGIYNVGNYRGHIKAPDRIGCFCGGPRAGLRQHWHKCRARGIPLQAAIAIGVSPNLAYAAVARVEPNLNEYGVAGGISGEPLELVRARTVDLLVPAHAELIIEGLISTSELEPEGPFGEFPGYMANQGYSFFMQVTCITMRRDPIYVGFLSQFPPSESSKIRGVACEGVVRKRLAVDAGMDNVLDVAFHEASGSWGYTVIKIQKRAQEDVERIFDTLKFTDGEGAYQGKVLVIVDDDIDARDADAVNWAISYRMQPHRDVRIVDAYTMGLDQSIVPPDQEESVRNPVRKTDRTSALFIDATRSWPYPPISLPRREFMERALVLWEELGLPPLEPLKQPWYGYELGFWAERSREEAQAALAGQHFETGRRAASERKPVER